MPYSSNVCMVWLCSGRKLEESPPGLSHKLEWNQAYLATITLYIMHVGLARLCATVVMLLTVS